MTIKQAVEELGKNRQAIQEHEDAINEIIGNSLKTVYLINHDLVQIADMGYELDTGEWNMDEGRNNGTGSKIGGLDICLDALTETLKRMRTIKDDLDVEGEF